MGQESSGILGLFLRMITVEVIVAFLSVLTFTQCVLGGKSDYFEGSKVSDRAMPSC